MGFILIYFYKIINYFHTLPLCLAIEKRNIEMVKLLLSSGKVDVNIKKKGI